MAEQLYTVVLRPRTREYALVPLSVYRCFHNKGGVPMLDTALGELPYFMAVRAHEAQGLDMARRHERIVRYLTPAPAKTRKMKPVSKTTALLARISAH